MRPFRKTLFMVVAAPVLALVSAASPLSRESSDLSKRLQKSEKVIKAVMIEPADKGIPAELLQRASCIGVFPNIKKGSKSGSGVFSCRQPDGTMGAPAFFTISGSNFEWEDKEADLIVLIVSDEGVASLLRDSFTLGADGMTAAGPVGRNLDGATDAQKKAQVLAWSRSGRALLGASIERSVIKPNMKEIKLVYRSMVSPKAILLERSVTMSPEGKSFAQTLSQCASRP